ncbi:hypothetical protein EDC56_3619 [Sinobacterium caligoides]|uniref:Uncharacterized protein n=1 Tax=Sinobacterium caligoides TaxID=933926 RepID=A0A3N2DDS3_9GAMM|nr:hypothetical protein [Sinobacterium caligoides]ROR97950.1 hypothetical protein EDC56_3619 [Sinobacterium caligoides]
METAAYDTAAIEQDYELNWDLHAITNRDEAIDFLRRFENKLCIYSSFVNIIYSSYQFLIPDNANYEISVLPSQIAHHDNFHRIPKEAVVDTGIFLYPGECSGDSGLFIKIPCPLGLVSSREMPFKAGLLDVIKQFQARDEIFLPIVIKGSLREYESRVPSLHLHTIDLKQLSHLSELELESLQRVVVDNLMKIFKDN